MSWCLGMIGAADRELPADAGTTRLSIDAGDLRLRAGGPEATCRHAIFPEAVPTAFDGWLVLGLGIDIGRGSPALLDDQEWGRRLAPAEPLIDDLDGHYLIVRWDSGSIEFRSDPLGMRTLFLARSGDGVVFSSRLDWLARAIGGGEIDFAAFGAHWLGFNKFTSTSTLHGVTRLGPGGVARCDRGGIRAEEEPWIPEPGEPSWRDNPVEVLDALLSVAAASPGGLTLGLSGGLDSRLLLSILTGTGQTFAAHLFGAGDEPDVALGSRIAEDLGIELLRLEEPLPDAPRALDLLAEYVGVTGVIEPASAIMKLRYYPRLAATGRMMIDGGMGEIARRQFGNRLLRRARPAIMQRDAAGMMPHLLHARADIFTAEVDAIMRNGMIAELGQLLEAMPDPGGIGPENFVDLLVVRSRFPHVAGMEQGRVDGELPNFMPYAQPTFVRSALRLPIVERRNGRMFRRMIAAEAPALKRYPLVKSQIYYPYRLTTVPAWLWTHGRKLIGGSYQDRSVTRFLALMREEILSMLASDDVRTFAPYDQTKLARIVEGYYGGDSTLESAVDWWLAFEIWRRGVGASG